MCYVRIISLCYARIFSLCYVWICQLCYVRSYVFCAFFWSVLCVDLWILLCAFFRRWLAASGLAARFARVARFACLFVTLTSVRRGSRVRGDLAVLKGHGPNS